MGGPLRQGVQTSGDRASSAGRVMIVTNDRLRTGISLLILFAAAVLLVAVARIIGSSGRVAASGGETLVASIRSDRGSFNRYVASDLPTTVLTYLMHGSLVRVNRATHELEPELAERWELLADQRTYRLH